MQQKRKNQQAKKAAIADIKIALKKEGKVFIEFNPEITKRINILIK